MTASHCSKTFGDSRRERCLAMGLDLSRVGTHLAAALDHPEPLVAIVSSRVGHDVQRHRSLSQQIAATMQRMRRDGETVLVAEGTAAEPWVRHAAGVFHVPVLPLVGLADRDRIAIAIADRVDAAYVRRGGKITSLLRRRARLESGLVRVAIDPSNQERDVVWGLLDAGAIGRYLPTQPRSTTSNSAASECWPGSPEVLSSEQVDWSSYLVHCTRAAAGPWPGQTWQQYRDDLLLAGAASASRDCIDSLCRIISKRRLIAGAITSCRVSPVVCFSAVPLPKLLARRVYRSHLHRWDYEPYGIAITHAAAARLGAMPVIYGDRETKRQVPDEQQYRFQSSGTTRDWTLEEEWRIATDVDLSLLDASEALIFVPDETSGRRVSRWSRGGWPVVVVASQVDSIGGS